MLVLAAVAVGGRRWPPAAAAAAVVVRDAARRRAAAARSSSGTATSTSSAPRSRSSPPSTTPQDPAWKVEPVFSGNSDYALQKLLTAMAGGKAPDIMYQYGSSLANLARSPKIVNMGDLIAQDAGLRLERLLRRPSGWRARSTARCSAVPSLVDNLCLVYNKKLFDQAGVSYPTAYVDLDRLPRRRQEAHRRRRPSSTAGPTSPTAARTPCGATWRRSGRPDGDLLNADNTKAAFDSPAGLKSMTLLHDMAVIDKSVYLDTRQRQLPQPVQQRQDRDAVDRPLGHVDDQHGRASTACRSCRPTSSHASIAGPDDWVMVDNGADRVQGAWDFLQWFTSAEGASGVRASRPATCRSASPRRKLPAYKQYLTKYPYAERLRRQPRTT